MYSPEPAAEARTAGEPSGEARRVAHRGMVGASAAMRDVHRRIERLGPSDACVLIIGETGTGKTLCAGALHQAGDDAGPLVRVNCAALTDDLLRSELFGHRKGAFTGAHEDHGGLLARADGGTLFLDEIGDLPAQAQAKLLRALEEGRFRPVGADRPLTAEFRLVAATHRDLDAMVEAGRFREDLLYRLGVARIALPPLRERREDVPLLASHFLRRLGGESDGGPAVFSEEALGVLSAHPWPGNVRELQQAVEAAALFGEGEEIGAEVVRSILPPRDGNVPSAEPPLDLRSIVERAERQAVRAALRSARGHRERAAELLGIGTSSLYRKLERHDIQVAAPEADP